MSHVGAQKDGTNANVECGLRSARNKEGNDTSAPTATRAAHVCVSRAYLHGGTDGARARRGRGPNGRQWRAAGCSGRTYMEHKKSTRNGWAEAQCRGKYRMGRAMGIQSSPCATWNKGDGGWGWMGIGNVQSEEGRRHRDTGGYETKRESEEVHGSTWTACAAGGDALRKSSASVSTAAGGRTAKRDIPNNLYIQHPCEGLLHFNSKADRRAASLSLLLHPQPKFFELSLFRNIRPLPRDLRPRNSSRRRRRIHECRRGAGVVWGRTRVREGRIARGRVETSATRTGRPQQRRYRYIIRERLERQSCSERGGHERRERRG